MVAPESNNYSTEYPRHVLVLIDFSSSKEVYRKNIFGIIYKGQYEII